MKLSQLMEGLDYLVLQGDAETEVADVAYDSRKVQPGFAFVCVVGTNRDSHDYAEDVAAAGASVLVIQHKLDEMPAGVTVVQVENSRHALAIMSCNLFGNPAKKMTMIGVTGTKGKTTTAHMIQAALNAAGKKCGIIGTNGTAFAGERHALANTTPESYELQKLFSEMLAAGCDSVVMEVSSQGLMMSRVDGIHFDVGVFTNLYPDHIGGPGEHQSFEEYRAWKGQLFRRCDVGVVNVDDETGMRILRNAEIPLVTYGCDNPSDVFAIDYAPDEDGCTFIANLMDDVTEMHYCAPGKYNMSNVLCAAAIAKVLGAKTSAIASGASKVSGVAGRFEVIRGKGKRVVIDYAHTPDGLDKALRAVREITPGKVITVFGCGGDRDRTKRAAMGEIASELSDFAVITSDNPRSEPPARIIDEIAAGAHKRNFVKREDRREGIEYALDMCGEGDTVLIAGKGHENTQEIAGVKSHFSDEETVRELLK